MIFTWTNIQDVALNQVFSYPLANWFRNNLEALKERFSAEHNWADGTHTKRGSVAFCTMEYTGSSYVRVGGSYFNVASVSRTGTGVYVFTFSASLAYQYGTVIPGYGGGVVGDPRIVKYDLTTANCTLTVIDSNNNLADIGTGEYLTMAVFQ